jgi:hypothetical protein
MYIKMNKYAWTYHVPIYSSGHVKISGETGEGGLRNGPFTSALTQPVIFSCKSTRVLNDLLDKFFQLTVFSLSAHLLYSQYFSKSASELCADAYRLRVRRLGCRKGKVVVDSSYWKVSI